MAPVTSIRAEVAMKASAEATWTWLIDTSTWPEWNTFVPEADPIFRSDDLNGSPTTLRLGSRYRFIANMRGRKWTSRQRVTVFETPKPEDARKVWRISWEVQGYPKILFRTVRFNEIEEVTTEEGNECVYRTGEDQSGPLAYFVNMVFGQDVEKGIKNWADDLKRVMEA